VSQLRLNPLTGRWVTVSTDRAARPDDFALDQEPVETGPVRPCPFCPGNEEATPPALESYRSGDTWSVRVVPNRFPAFEGTEPMQVENLGPLFTQAPASGIHEVLVFSPDHGSSYADLDDLQAGLVVSAVRDRMEAHAASSGVRYTQAIVNHGREAGASLSHPHGQLLGMPFVPGELVEEMAGFRRFSGHCLLCATIEAERDAVHRMVFDRDEVVIIAPFWGGAPFELLVMPTVHEGHLANTPQADLEAVSRALRDALGLLRKTLGEVSYNLVVHTLPHRASDPFHWHIHVLPRVRSVGAFEQGTGVPINIVAPERAADLLLG
jgi:UDPglucose--hexose-1-phosphate uridylyltransferase